MLECAIIEAMKVLMGASNQHKKGKKYIMRTPEMQEVLTSIGAKLKALHELQQDADRALIKLKDAEPVEAITEAYTNFGTIDIEEKINDGTLAKTSQALYSDLAKFSNDVDTHRDVFTKDVNQTLKEDFSKIPYEGIENLSTYEVQMKRLNEANDFLGRSIPLYTDRHNKLKEAVETAN